MVSGACLTLALLNLRIAFGDVKRGPHVFFFFAALAVAAVSAFELTLLREDDLARYETVLRWAVVPIGAMVASVTGFVWSLFGTGRAWLALTGVGLNVASQIANLVSTVPVVRHAVAIHKVETLGGVQFTLPAIVNGTWNGVELASVIAVMAFVFDASLTLWKRGGRRRAVMVGGSIILFFLLARGHAILVEKGILPTPYFVSFSFLAVLVAMGLELSDEVFRSAKLGRDLLESERRMDLAARSASLGFWTWDIPRDEIWASSTARELFEIPSDERVGFERFVETLHVEDREGVEHAIQAALAGSGEYEKEYRVMLRDGGQRWIDARGKVEFDGRGKPTLMRGVLLDITSQHLSEQELQQVRGQLAHAGRVSMMGQLASALAHELNQPLGAILRNAEAAEIFLQEQTPDLQELRAIISDIRKDDQRAGEVIDRLRTLLKRRSLDTQTLNMEEVLAEVFSLARADASARGVRIEIVVALHLPKVRGDRVHLQQVLLNLIINAMDAMRDVPDIERCVSINAQREAAGFIEVAVMDNGHGVPAEKLVHVFEAFFTTKAEGMGMGLPISRTIVEAHGGRITAQNREQGGAVFRFTLPIVDNGPPSHDPLSPIQNS